MARMRTVKPGLRTSRVVATWPVSVRYCWVLLWGYLDDVGRGLDNAKTIAGDCFPYDDKITASRINQWLSVMASTKGEPDRDPPLCRYEVAGQRYIHSVYWSEHQKPNRPSPSQHPPCPIHESLSESLTESLTEPFSEAPLSPHVLELEGLKGRGLEGAVHEPGSETPAPRTADPEPPRQCSAHLQDLKPPPCRQCQAARERWQTWHAHKRKRIESMPDCEKHPGSAGFNCGLCRSERLAGDA